MQNAITKESSLLLFVSPSSIIMATDLTEIKQLLPHAIAQAKLTEAHVTLVPALETPDTVLLDGNTSVEQTRAMQRAHQILDNAASHVQAQGVRCSTVTREGHALDLHGSPSTLSFISTPVGSSSLQSAGY